MLRIFVFAPILFFGTGLTCADEIPKSVPGVLEMHLYGPFKDDKTFPTDPGEPLISWRQESLGFVRLPNRYDDWGVRDDWGTGVMVRALTEVTLEPGDYEILSRSRSLSRLIIDGETLVNFGKQKRGGGAHNKVVPIAEVPREGMRPPAMDDVEKLVKFNSEGGNHTVVFDVIVGGPKLRLEFGEACVAIAKEGEMFRLMGPDGGPELTDEGWLRFVAKTEEKLTAIDVESRTTADRQVGYWDKRHALAAKHLVAGSGDKSGDKSIDGLVTKRIERARKESGDPDSFFNREVRPIFSEHCYRCHGEKEKGDLNLQVQKNILAGGESGFPSVVPGNLHESFLLEVVTPDAGPDQMPPKGEGLTSEEIEVLKRWVKAGGGIEAPPLDVADVSPQVDDLTFLRRVWIDTLGVAPPIGEVRRFESSHSPEKKEEMIDQLLENDRWADNWMGYWQDVLAENPNLLKPNLNNTGPFRYWIHEALLDNKAMDRFATELITMRGSTWGGGASGFSIASQNDVPMAAKAHIIGTAFLGVDMKCARCHDAPYHETTQENLFQMAAMLKKEEIKVPATSSVPATFFDHVKEGGRESLIQVTLDIGSKVKPVWPFDEFCIEKPDGVLRKGANPREHIAAEVTFSRRFAEVLVNRVWKRFMGAGLVEPVDDWEGHAPSDPELLRFLADEFIRGGYDLKHLSKLILTSRVYQREAINPPAKLTDSERFFEGPYRRRMSAEQVVDNAWHVVGREMNLGSLTMDIEGRLAPDKFLNFGCPKRAWEFTTMANERDRPSLAMPKFQAIVDVLLAFGWRNSRQEPTTVRMEEPNPLQPGVLANGVMGGWLTRLTDDSELTQLCLDAKSAKSLTDELFLRFLTRQPTGPEREKFESLLADGFETRVVPESEIAPVENRERTPYVSWSNHLHGEANLIKQRQEELARRGPAPTRFLRNHWREQAEDVLWALMNSPEMTMVP